MRGQFKLKIKIILFLIITIVLFACDAAEGLFTDRKAPNVNPIQSEIGFEVDPGDTLRLTVNATNPEDGELGYEWSADNNAGTIIGSVNETTFLWKAPLSGGTYRISVKVSNDYKSTTNYVDVIVRSKLNPYVNISAPSGGTYLIQFTPIIMEFEAVHNNGIALIYIYINDQKIDSLVGLTQTDYSYNWNVSASSGDKEIKVVAISKITDKVGSDSINVTIEGIIPGKSGD